MAFLFISRFAHLLPVLPFPYLRGSYRFRLLWRCGAGRGVGRIVGGRRRDLASRSSSVPFYLSLPSLRVRSISSYRFVGGWCAPFLSARFPAMFCGGLAYRLLFRLVPRLVCPSRAGVSLLFFRFARRLVLLIVPRLVRRSGSPSCSSFLGVSLGPAHRFPSRPLVSSWRLVKQSVFSFRFGGPWCRVVSLRLVLFCSRRISLVASHGHGGGSSFVASFRSSRG